MVPSYVFQALFFFIAHFLTSNFHHFESWETPRPPTGLASWPAVKGRFSTKPWKINMEHTNHPFRKENDLNQAPMMMFHVNLPECNPCPLNSAGFFFGSDLFFGKNKRDIWGVCVYPLIHP